MIHLATLIRGNEFNILFPWADLDLRDFIYEEQDQFSYLKRPSILINEASNLANALDFLHEGIRIPGRGKVCCIHMDLKPENIVVRIDESLGTMRWMITDFGISTMKEKAFAYPSHRTTANDLLALNSAGDVAANLTGNTPRRNPGPFQAPEVQEADPRLIGRKSDVWSLGCILSLILALATGSREGARAIDQARREDPDADCYYYRRTTDLLPNNRQSWEVNRCVLKYLKALPANCRDLDHEWVSAFVSLILDTLSIDIGRRPWAAQVYERLSGILECLKKVSIPDDVVPNLVETLNRTDSERFGSGVQETGTPEPSDNDATSFMDQHSNDQIPPSADKPRKNSWFKLGRAVKTSKSCARAVLSPCGQNVAIISEESVLVYSTTQLLDTKSSRSRRQSITEASQKPVFVAEEVQTKFVKISSNFLLTGGDGEVSGVAISVTCQE